MKQPATKLSQVKVFDKLPQTVCQTLIEQARYYQLQPDEFLFHQGDVWPHVVFLVSGELRWAMLSVSSREHVLFMVRPDEVFWAHSFFDDQPMPASLMAAKKAEVYVWRRDIILPVLLKYPEAMWQITKIQVETMRLAREIIYSSVVNLVFDTLNEVCIVKTCVLIV